jgi:hypothetical protein
MRVPGREQLINAAARIFRGSESGGVGVDDSGYRPPAAGQLTQ